MSSQNIFVLSTFFVLSFILPRNQVFAYGDYGGGGSYQSGSGDDSGISATQQRRASERFDIISWIRGNQMQIAAQNSKYGYSKGGSRAFLDVKLDYEQDSGQVTRNSTALGNDTRSTGHARVMWDDLFINSNQRRSLNLDVGFEGFLNQTTSFSAANGTGQLSHSYAETGGGLILRPFGRSSQDTGLLVKGGYDNLTETGLWANNQTQFSMYGTYLGAEAKIYLLPFLGIEGDYTTVLEQEVPALQGKWKMQRFSYGAFLEVYLVKISAYLMSTEMDLTPDSGIGPIKEIYSGAGVSGTFYF